MGPGANGAPDSVRPQGHRPRSIDTSGLDLVGRSEVDRGEYGLGLGRGSLSPDGTRLAIGQAEGVVVVDLTTAESRTYPVDGLGEAWTGRSTYWTPDAVLDQPVARGQRWAALRQLSVIRPWDRDGVVVLDEEGRPLTMLPVQGVENNGGGGQVIGWASDSVVLFSMPEVGASQVVGGVVAWDVDTGELWRGPRILADSYASVARP